MNVFLTGASSGIGQALAREFAARGARLGLVARRAAPLEALARELGGRHLVYPVDVTERAALVDAARGFDADSGGADIVIACAGISDGIDTADERDLDVLREILAVNVVAMATTFHPFIAPMRARGRGTLVGIGSVAGIRGLPGSGGYCGSKAAAMTYCESLRVELRGSGIRVVTIAPGFVRTPMTFRNPYPMPFLMDAAPFARRAVGAILARRSYAVIPWQMGVVAKLLRLLPNPVYDAGVAGRQRKPRRGD